MRKIPVILAVAFALSTGVCAFGADKSSDNNASKAAAVDKAKETKKSKPEGSKRAKKTELTGSYIKHEVRRAGQITDGPSPVLVIDSNTIRNSGASDIRQLLTRQGVNR